MRLPHLLLALPFAVSAPTALVADTVPETVNYLCLELDLGGKDACDCLVGAWKKDLPVWDQFLFAYAEYYDRAGGNLANWQNDVDQILARKNLNVGATSIQNFYDTMITEMERALEACG